MSSEFDKKLSEKYCPRFAQIAVERGFITADQAKKALEQQFEDNLANNPHRLIGNILLENEWITPTQIEIVLNELFSKIRMSA